MNFKIVLFLTCSLSLSADGGLSFSNPYYQIGRSIQRSGQQIVPKIIEIARKVGRGFETPLNNAKRIRELLFSLALGSGSLSGNSYQKAEEELASLSEENPSLPQLLPEKEQEEEQSFYPKLFEHTVSVPGFLTCPLASTTPGCSSGTNSPYAPASEHGSTPREIGYSDDSENDNDDFAQSHTPTRVRKVTVEVTPNSLLCTSRNYGNSEREVIHLDTRQKTNETGSIYIITLTGEEVSFNNTPIWDATHGQISGPELQSIIEHLRNLGFGGFRIYVGLTEQTLPRRAYQHGYACATDSERRLPKALIESNGGDMHAILINVPKTQLLEIEAQLIRALGGTASHGLNSCTGEHVEGESAPRGWVEVTPNSKQQTATDTPNYRPVLTPTDTGFVEQERTKEPRGDIIYMVTRAFKMVDMPIIDLRGQLLSAEQLADLRELVLRHFNTQDFEFYIGIATRGKHQDRTALTRAREHEISCEHSPYRRLQRRILEINTQNSEPVLLHSLFVNANPGQIRELEHWTIQVLGGLTPRCLNSNPGSSTSGGVVGAATRVLFD